MESLLIGIAQIAISTVITIFSVAFGVELGLGWYLEKGHKKLKVENSTCLDCEFCDVRDDNGDVWCYKHGRKADLDDKACEDFEEE